MKQASVTEKPLQRHSQLSSKRTGRSSPASKKLAGREQRTGFPNRKLLIQRLMCSITKVYAIPPHPSLHHRSRSNAKVLERNVEIPGTTWEKPRRASRVLRCFCCLVTRMRSSQGRLGRAATCSFQFGCSTAAVTMGSANDANSCSLVALLVCAWAQGRVPFCGQTEAILNTCR